MPLGNTSQDSSRHKRSVDFYGDEEATSAWSIPLGRLAGVRFYLSGGVLVGLALLSVLIATATGQQKNADLPLVALLGTLFWLAGWTIQTITALLVSSWLGHSFSIVTWNLWGMESRPRRVPPMESLTITMAMLATVIVCGAAAGWLGGGMNIAAAMERREFWASPPVAFADRESIWLFAGWLLCIQALIQMYPLPRTAGRQILAALTSLCGKRLDTTVRTAILRRVLVLLSLMTATMSLLMIASQEPTVMPSWPLVLLLAVLLGVSSRSRDLAATITGMQAGSASNTGGTGTGLDEQPTPESQRAPGWRTPDPTLNRSTGVLTLAQRFVRERRERRRVRKTMEAERREAMDAARVDEILVRLHDEGVESLSDEDRRILERVSKSLRRLRDRDSRPDVPE